MSYRRISKVTIRFIPIYRVVNNSFANLVLIFPHDIYDCNAARGSGTKAIISNEHGNANDKINGLGLFFREFVGARTIYLANHRIVVYYPINIRTNSM